MRIRTPVLASLVLALAMPAVAQQARPAPQLTDDQKTLLHCAATFALVSGRHV